MKDEKYIAALEISSSKILGAVARYTSSGQLDVIAVEQEKAVEGVRFGIIRNLEDTAMRISRIIDKLERKPSVTPRKISGVFIGLSGRSLKSIHHETELSLPEDTEIDDEILKRLHDNACNAAIDNSLEVVDVVPRVYYVGSQETHSPKGMIGDRIRGIYDLIVCRPELKKNIERTIQEKLKLDINGFVVTSLAASRLILSSEERRLGCMLVDFGAETTTVSIFKNNNMVYFATLPMGSRNITRDLTSLNILEERAEEIKITSGNASHTNASGSLDIGGIKINDIAGIIVPRAEEIAANILEQPIYADLEYKDLHGGAICIGGGFKLNGMLDLISQVIPAKRAQMPPFVHVEDTRVPSADLIQVTGILYIAATTTDKESLETNKTEELPEIGTPNVPGGSVSSGKQDTIIPEEPHKPNKIIAGLKDKLKNWFGGEEDEMIE